MFLKRLISGAVLLLLSFFFIFFGGKVLIAFLLCLSLQAWYELSRVLSFDKEKKNGLINVFGYIAILIYYGLLAFTDNRLYVIMAVTLSIIGLLVVYVFSYPKYEIQNISEAVFSFIYAPVMLSFVYLTRELPNGIYIVWMIYISSWGADTLAYCVGMLTGKTIGNHKMSPKLSPKKSIEGAVGGILGAAILGFIYAKFFMGKAVSDIPNLEWMLAIISAAGAFLSMIGDLAASAIKRNKDIKDYGKCIPGHGGIMDRFDSMIFTAPITYFLAVVLLSVM